MMFRLRKSEWLVILLLLTSGIGFLVLFFLDLYHRIDISEKDIIGIVEYKNNIVPREYLEYEFNLSQSPEFVGNVFVSREEKNFFKPKEPLKPGTYFWKVRGKSVLGRLSPYSGLGRFQIFPEGSFGETTETENAVAGLSKSEPLSNQEKSFAPASAEAEKKSSKPELPSNSIVIYPKDTVVDLSGAYSLSFEWSKWKVGREEYILSLYMYEKSTRRPVFQVKTRGTNYSYKNLKNLEEGKFSWEIAVHSGGRIVHRETSHFLITIGNLRSLSPEDIEFITPSVLYRTSGRTSGQAKD